MRTTEEGLHMPSLLTGYFLLTFVMVIAYPYFNLKANWFKKGAIWGLTIGFATFVSGHLIVAGWAKIPPTPMLISGVIDVMATVVTGLVIAYFYRNE